MIDVTFKVTEKEKKLMQSMAELEGLTLPDFARMALLEMLEDKRDLKLYEEAMAAHELKDESVSHEEMLRELGL